MSLKQIQRFTRGRERVLGLGVVIIILSIVVLIILTQQLSGSFPTQEEWEYMQEQGIEEEYGKEKTIEPVTQYIPSFEFFIAGVGFVFVVVYLKRRKE